MTKSELRKEYLEKRRLLPLTEAASMSAAISEHFFREFHPMMVTAVHTFIRIKKLNEVDTSNIYFKLWRDHPWIRTFAPRTDPQKGTLENVEFHSGTELAENVWGIREPAGDETDPEVLDLAIVPMLCFDRTGHRVGYGKGYYDEFLRRCRPDCVKAGVSFFPPVERIDDVHDGDMPLDVCITPARVHRFGVDPGDGMLAGARP
jgi:5-formyltetrahydrofolate cyclo-ligase